MGPPIWKNPLILTTNILGLGIKIARSHTVFISADAQKKDLMIMKKSCVYVVLLLLAVKSVTGN